MTLRTTAAAHRGRNLVVAVLVSAAALSGCGNDAQSSAAATEPRPATSAANGQRYEKMCQLLAPVLDNTGRWSKLKADRQHLALLLPRVAGMVPQKQQSDIATIVQAERSAGTAPSSVTTAKAGATRTEAERARYDFALWVSHQCSTDDAKSN